METTTSSVSESKNFFQKTWQFLKKPKVKVWLACMAIVILVSVSVMSVIMIANSVDYSKDLRPYRDDVYSITVMNENISTNSGRKEFNNSFIDRTSNANEGKVLSKILDKLHDASKTSRFAQFFGGQANGDEKIAYDYIGYDTSSNFTSVAKNVYIKIKFNSPVYVINGEQRDSASPIRAELYDPNYEQPRDENGRYYGTLTNTYHRDRVVNAIYIPLGAVTNSFDKQTWFLCLGSDGIKYDKINHTEMNCSLSTYGNYNSLKKYVNGLDETSF